MRLRRRGVSVALMLAVLAACSATSAPERAFQTYRQAVADSDWALAWSLLSERVQGGYGGSHDLYSSEMKGFFARPDLRLQFTTTKVLGVEMAEEGRAALLRARHETLRGGSAERSWRLVNTDEGWKLDEL